MKHNPSHKFETSRVFVHDKTKITTKTGKMSVIQNEMVLWNNHTAYKIVLKYAGRCMNKNYR